MNTIILEIKKVFANLKKQPHSIIFFSSLAALFLILFCIVPTLSKTVLLAVTFVFMSVLFLVIYSKAKAWKASEHAITITSYVLYELTILGEIGFWALIPKYNFSPVATVFTLVYLTAGLLYATMLLMYTKKKNPRVIATQKARDAQQQKHQEEFERLITVTNESLDLIRTTAERMPQINERFFELTSRVDAIEKRFAEMVKKREEDEQKLLNALIDHSRASMTAMEQLKDSAYNTITSERERFKKETEIIVETMSESLDGIITAIEDSFAPFGDSIKQLGSLDETTSSAIDRLSEAAEIFVKISEPQARLAGEAADLISESLVNMKSIASQSLNIVSIELKDRIDDAVNELKIASLN